MVSDNGKQFFGGEFKAFLKWRGIKHIRVFPYYARGNGKLERFHQYLRKNFRAAMVKENSLGAKVDDSKFLFRQSTRKRKIK